jgi:ADP-ribosylation factor GTPase-activating protein 1
LGKANESRPSDLPPSQGGRYQGFGNTPGAPSQHPSYGLSSSAAPSLTDLQENPLGALTKGWSLFSSAVVGAGRAVSENVIQPGVEKVTDPNFQASVKGYMTEAQKKAAAAGGAVNQWSKHQLGVDVGESVGGMVGTVKDRFSDPTKSGYGAVPTESYGETSGLYQDGSDDLFHEYDHDRDQLGSGHSSVQPTSVQTKSAPAPAKKNSGWDDEWKDF